jgi:glycerol-3-phosphate dehydrogenase
MAEDVLEKCADKKLLPLRPQGATVNLKLVGAMHGGAAVQSICLPPGLPSYGDERDVVAQMPGADVELVPGLTEGMVRFAARYEYAVTVEDVLARRSRLLFLDAALALTLAQRVSEILLEETGLPPKGEEFTALGQQYLLA